MLRLNTAPMLRRLAGLAMASALILAAAPSFAQSPVGPGASAVTAVPPAVTDRDFVVFFKEWGAAIDDPAASVIAAAAKTAKAYPSEPVIVTGYADPTGSARANALISALRAEQVYDALVAAGVSAGRIERTGDGSTHFVFVAQESRRVTISIGPK